MPEDSDSLPVTGDNRSSRAAWAVRSVFFILAVLCFSGLTGRALDTAMAPVHGANKAYLERSLTYTGGVIGGITALRAGISVVESGSVKFLGTGLEPGRAVEPVNDLLADISDYMLVYAVLVVAQLAVTEVIKAVALKYVLGAGALLCALGARRWPGLMRSGLLFVFIGLVLYLVYPLMLLGASEVFASHQSKASLELTEDLGVLKERAGDLLDELRSLDSLSDAVSGASGVFGRFIALASDGGTALWRGTLNLMVSMVILFVLTPLAALGVSYMCIRQALSAVEGAGAVQRMEAALAGAIERIRKRDEGKAT